MSSVTQKLHSKGLIQPPAWMPSNVFYETIMGSVAYHVSNDTSDMDVYGFAIPSKEIIFPYSHGRILGFGQPPEAFNVYQEHHIKDGEKQYDLNIYSIVSYFNLCLGCNPNMIDSLFTPFECILCNTTIGKMVRDNRKLFLSKKAWHTFKGYAYQQTHKMKIKQPTEGSKRFENVQKFGYDVKYAYHLVRLMDEIEQLLTTGEMDITRDRERLKAIRRGEWKEEDVYAFFAEKEKSLETLYNNCTALPHTPNEAAVFQLLVDCLEQHYGSITKMMGDSKDTMEKNNLAMKEILDVLKKHGINS